MKVIKKNQILVFVAALVLVTTGYLAYNNKDLSGKYISTTSDNISTSGIGDATLVSSKTLINSIVTNSTKEENTIETSTKTDDYFTVSRMEREKMYSQMLESYQKIIDNTNMSAEQKTIATKEISKINNTKNAIMISENLIKTKGIEDVVIFVNLDSISVVIKAKELNSDRVAQVQNIVSRELNADTSNIHISSKY